MESVADIEDQFRKIINEGSTVQSKYAQKAQISSLKLGFLSTEQIRRMGAVRIETDDLKIENRGLYDLSMGSIERERKCTSCNGDARACLGHFGYYEFRNPFIHPKVLKTVTGLLNLFCDQPECLDAEGHSKLLHPESRLHKYDNYNYLKRLEAIQEHEKANASCNIHTCDQYVVKTKPRSTVKVIKRVSKAQRGKEERDVSLEEIEDKLKRIKDSDLELLGLQGIRPENFIIKAMLILPTRMRPYREEQGKRKDHDITRIYSEIIKADRADNAEKVLQFYQGLIDNSKGLCKGPHGVALLSIKDLLQTKAGLIRSTIDGKRGNFCARTVISPDINIKLWQVGLPIDICRIITTKDTVYRLNIDHLTDLWNRGEIRSIRKRGGHKIMYALLSEEARREVRLEHGDEVSRYLQDGDPITLNRQPSLHKHSILGMQVRRLPGRTIRLHPSLCTGYNADFDGDEMNIMVPQNYMQKAEVMELMNVMNCIVSESTGKPIVGFIQNAALGIFEMTADNIIVPRSVFMNALIAGDREYIFQNLIERARELGVHPSPFAIETFTRDLMVATTFSTEDEEEQAIYDEYIDVLEGVDDEDARARTKFEYMGRIARIRAEQVYSGKVLFSSLLPPDFNYRRTFEGQDIVIQNGILLFGRINKAIAASGDNSIIQTIHRRYGRRITAEFINDTWGVTKEYLRWSGFTIGYAHCMRNNRQEEKINRLLALLQLQTTPRETDPILAMKEEVEITQKLRNARDNVAKIIFDQQDEQVINVPESVQVMYSTYVNGQSMIDPNVVRFNMSYSQRKVTATFRDGHQQDLPVTGLVSISIIYSGGHDVYHYVTPINPFRALIDSGAKGAKMNLAQLAGIIGQMELGGQRIPLTLTNSTRVLPHFIENDPRPLARGFCSSAYYKGMKPLEYYMHAIAARQDVAATALVTPTSGYLERRLGKLMEDAYTFTDLSVRNVSNNEIIQFLYGDNGFATDRIAEVSGKPAFSNIKQRYFEIKSRRYTPNAYVIFVTPQNIQGALVTIHSLKLMGVRNDIVAIADISMIRRAATGERYKAEIIAMESVLKQFGIRVITATWNSSSWVLNMTEYQKVLVINGNMIFLKNPDSIFELPAPGYLLSEFTYAPYARGGPQDPFLGMLEAPSDLVADNEPRYYSILLLEPNRADAALYQNSEPAELLRYYTTIYDQITNIPQIYQYSVIGDVKWLRDTGYIIDDVVVMSYYWDRDEVWNQFEDRRNVLWFETQRNLITRYPATAIFYAPPTPM